MFRVHAVAAPPRNYREAFWNPLERKRITFLLDHLLENGITMINTCSAALSTAMGESEIDDLVAALESGFARMRDVD
jgi:glutamate-1-semialdehyde 2,1-aminomutase